MSAQGDSLIVVDDAQKSLFIGEHVSYLIDKESSFTIDDIRSSQGDLLFKRFEKRLFSVRNIRSPVWFKIDLLYQPKAAVNSGQRVIDLRSSASFDDIEFYQENEAGQYEVISTGIGKAVDTRDIAVRSFAFHVNLTAGKRDTIYFRIRPESSLKFDPYLRTPDSFYQTQIASYAFIAVFLGIAISIMVYHGYQYLLSRHTSDAAFLLYLTFLLLFLLNQQGFSYHFSWLLPDIKIHFKRIYLGLSLLLCNLIFVYKLLDIGSGQQHLNRIFKTLFVCSGAMYALPVVLHPFFGIYNPINQSFIAVFFLVSHVTMIGAAIYGVKMRHPSAKYLLTAELCAVVGQQSGLLTNLGLIPMNELSYAIPFFGTGTQVLLQSLSLVSKYEKLRVDHQQMQKKLLQTAEESNRTKTEFLSVINHELRTPLNGLFGSLSILKNSVPKAAQEWFTNCQRFAENMSLMVNKILDFTDLQSGNFRSRNESFSVQNLIDDLSVIYKPACEDKNLAFQVMAADVERGGKYTGDKKVLKRALMILLDNAVIFTNSGTITLSVEPAGDDHYQFRVTDTGIGISDEHQASLFEPFSQVDASIAREYGGLGFSLALCQQLIAAIGGKLELDSALGTGSSFLFAIELAQNENQTEEVQDSQGEVSPQESTAASNRRILVVEDDEMNQLIMETVLENLGHQFVMADNGQIALNILSEDAGFDLVLMDCQMPEMDGFTATKHIRSSSGTIRDIPILAVTANLSSGDVYNCFESGMNEVIEKPVSPELLDQKILAYA